VQKWGALLTFFYNCKYVLCFYVHSCFYSNVIFNEIIFHLKNIQNKHLETVLYTMLTQAWKWSSGWGVSLVWITSPYINIIGYLGSKSFLTHSPVWLSNEPGSKISYVGIVFWPSTGTLQGEVWLLKQQTINLLEWYMKAPFGNSLQQGKEWNLSTASPRSQQGEPRAALHVFCGHFSILFWVKSFPLVVKGQQRRKCAGTDFVQCRYFPGESTILFLISLNLLKTCLLWHFLVFVWLLVLHSLGGLDYILWQIQALGVNTSHCLQIL
jgi:hypothetical protein